MAYIICATPRSGTTLLCDLLADTGVAGCPDSFFRLESLQWWAEYLGVPTADWPGEHAFDRAYLDAVVTEGAGGAKVFGMRLMWEQVENLSARLGAFYPGQSNDLARIRSAFGPTVFVHLSRGDKIAQAVSLLKAEQSGLWHIHSDGSERERLEPERRSKGYDPRVLTELVAEYENHDGAWLDWFARQEIEPLRITYESLSENPRAVLAKILALVGEDPGIAETVSPRTRKLANGESREWSRRLREGKSKR